MRQDIRILVVDDDADLLFATSRLLASAGFTVLEASTGQECMQMVSRRAPHLVLLDVVLPDIMGTELCDRIKKDPQLRHVFVVLISGIKTASADQVAGLDGGADGFIARPISNPELLARINAMVRLLETERALRKSQARLKASLLEKDTLLRELYHRTKNNMQAIMAMLDLQAQKTGNQETIGILDATITRIETMALVHEKLYQSKNLHLLDLKAYFIDLVRLLTDSLKDMAGNITVKIELASVEATIDTAVPCGLIVNELLSNAIKHGFPDGRTGEIRLILTEHAGDEAELRIVDDGVGPPPGLRLRDGDTLGIPTVWALAEHKLKAKVTVDTANGFDIGIRFKVPRPDTNQSAPK